MDFLNQPLPFKQAVDYFSKKIDLPSGRYTDIWQLQHSHTFTVARSTGFDVLGDIRGGIKGAIADGKTFADFKKELIPTLEKKGWFDSLGIDSKKSKSRRLKVIYNTNMRTAFSAGRWGQAEELKKQTGDEVYFEYVALLDSSTRPEHRSWDGIIRPIDDSFWDNHYPTNGWNCRCSVVTRTKASLIANGLKPAQPPKRITELKKDPVTGKMKEFTKGIDSAFDYNVGFSYDKSLRVFEGRKWDNANPIDVKNMLQSTLISKSFGRLINKGTRNAEYMSVGYAGKELQDKMSVKTGVIRMSGQTAKKQSRNHPDLSVEDYAIVQDIIDNGAIFKAKNKDLHWVGYLKVNGQWYRTAWKTIKPSFDEFWVLSLTKVKDKDFKLEKGFLIRKQGFKWLASALAGNFLIRRTS